MHVVTVTQVESDGDEEAKGVEESFELPCSLVLNGSSPFGIREDFCGSCMYENCCHKHFSKSSLPLRDCILTYRYWLYLSLFIAFRITDLYSYEELNHHKILHFL